MEESPAVGFEWNIAAIAHAIESVVPAHDAIVWRDLRLTWRDVGERSRRLAGALADRGFGLRRTFEECEPWESPHDHVALYLYNGNEYLEATLAAHQARCAPININYRYRSTELHHVLSDSAAAVVIYGGSFAETLAAVRDDLPDLGLLVQVDDGSGARLLDGAIGYEDLLSRHAPTLPPGLVDSWSPDDRYICYTGGTTGLPKGVVWRQGDFLQAALGIGVGRDWSGYDDLAAAASHSSLRALPTPPLMHGAAMWNALSCWAAGGAIILQDDTHHLDPADVWSSVERHGATSLLIVGDAFARPLIDEWDAHGGYDVPTLRHILSGGAVLSPTVKQGLVERLPEIAIVDVLGSTESGRQGVATSRVGATSAGFTPESSAVVLSEDRSRVLGPSDDAIGWLAQSGRVPLGYLGDAETTRTAFTRVGDLRCAIAGDRARHRADGSIELLGRDSVTINTGGEKVFAEEVETALKAHPAVFDALVCGRPSLRWGQEIVGVVALRDGVRVEADELRRWCRRDLADFKAPKAIVFVPAVVRSPSGKADYRWARDTAERAAPEGHAR